jgi:hypothetical protein
LQLTKRNYISYSAPSCRTVGDTPLDIPATGRADGHNSWAWVNNTPASRVVLLCLFRELVSATKVPSTQQYTDIVSGIVVPLQRAFERNKGSSYSTIHRHRVWYCCTSSESLRAQQRFLLLKNKPTSCLVLLYFFRGLASATKVPPTQQYTDIVSGIAVPLQRACERNKSSSYSTIHRHRICYCCLPSESFRPQQSRLFSCHSSGSSQNIFMPFDTVPSPGCNPTTFLLPPKRTSPQRLHLFL